MQLFRKFPFKDKPNTACITCSHILDENKPILYVTPKFKFNGVFIIEFSICAAYSAAGI